MIDVGFRREKSPRNLSKLRCCSSDFSYPISIPISSSGVINFRAAFTAAATTAAGFVALWKEYAWCGSLVACSLLMTVL